MCRRAASLGEGLADSAEGHAALAAGVAQVFGLRTRGPPHSINTNAHAQQTAPPVMPPKTQAVQDKLEAAKNYDPQRRKVRSILALLRRPIFPKNGSRRGVFAVVRTLRDDMGFAQEKIEACTEKLHSAGKDVTVNNVLVALVEAEKALSGVAEAGDTKVVVTA